jgi:hypothetical protein
VLHIDYDGTGDSSGGDGDPGRVEAWRRSIGAAVALMRAGGAPYVSLVGMRLGATLAASVSQDCKPEGLVLWDPCDSGRSYLREQAVLCLVYEPNEIGSAASGTGPATRDNGLGKVETLGNVYWPATVRAMSELTIGAIPDVLAGHVLALLRPGATKRSLLERLSELGAEVVDAVDQELMMDVSYSQLFAPQSTVGTIVRWLSQNAPTEMAPFTLATPGTATMSGPKQVVRGPHGANGPTPGGNGRAAQRRHYRPHWARAPLGRPGQVLGFGRGTGGTGRPERHRR